MIIENIITNELITKPKDWVASEYNSYYDYIVGESKKYHNLLNKIDEEEINNNNPSGIFSKENLINISERFSNLVISTLQEYLNNGNPHKAYDVFNRIMNEENKEEVHKYLSFYLQFFKLQSHHYRIRTHIQNPETKDLFHVPFQSRHNISSNRYSIPGHPTLYLSNSIFLAYKEFNSPDYTDCYVSKFTQDIYPEESLLDMRDYPKSSFFEDKYLFLARWILTLSCSVKVGYPDSPFKPEYIISQIIFQWVKNNIILGENKKKLLEYVIALLKQAYR